MEDKTVNNNKTQSTLPEELDEKRSEAFTPQVAGTGDAPKRSAESKSPKAAEDTDIFAEVGKAEKGRKSDRHSEDEAPDNAFERQLKRRRRRRRLKTFITLIVLALLAAGGYQLYQYLQKLNTKTEESTSVTTYRVQRVTEGSIKTTVAATGTLTPVATETMYPAYDDSTVISINVSLNGTFKKGDVLVTLELDEDNELMQQLETVENNISTTDRLADSRYLRAGEKGYIKDIKFYEGCDIAQVMEEHGYIALICLDNRMQVYVKAGSLTQYEKVDVVIAGKTYAGVVQEVKDGMADIIIESSKPEVGAEAEIFTADGTSVGKGKMELVAYAPVTAVDGFIVTVNVKDGQLVRKNDKIALCRDLPTTTAYQELIEQRDELLVDIEEATVIAAPFDGRVLEIDVNEGDTVGTETTLLVLQSMDGYRVSLSVDELDIASLQLGQKATVELDAIEDTSYEGTLSYISYVNSSTGNTVRYTVQVSVADIPGALPDMSATCTIITSDSGNGLIIPAEAVQKAEGKSVVYLAPEGVRFGQSYKDTELDLNTLRTEEVQVIQSDGSQLLVSGNIKEGDLILIKQLNTTSTYSSSSSNRENGPSNWGGPGGNSGGWGGNSGNFNGPSGNNSGRSSTSGSNRNSGGNSGSNRGN